MRRQYQKDRVRKKIVLKLKRKKNRIRKKKHVDINVNLDFLKLKNNCDYNKKLRLDDDYKET